jgi:hypothetical protein
LRVEISRYQGYSQILVGCEDLVLLNLYPTAGRDSYGLLPVRRFDCLKRKVRQWRSTPNNRPRVGMAKLMRIRFEPSHFLYDILKPGRGILLNGHQEAAVGDDLPFFALALPPSMSPVRSLVQSLTLRSASGFAAGPSGCSSLGVRLLRCGARDARRGLSSKHKC